MSLKHVHIGEWYQSLGDTDSIPLKQITSNLNRLHVCCCRYENNPIHFLTYCMQRNYTFLTVAHLSVGASLILFRWTVSWENAINCFPSHVTISRVIKHFWIFNTFSVGASFIPLKWTVSQDNIMVGDIYFRWKQYYLHPGIQSMWGNIVFTFPSIYPAHKLYLV